MCFTFETWASAAGGRASPLGFSYTWYW